MRIGDLDVTVRISDRRRTVGLTVERDGDHYRRRPAGDERRLARQGDHRQAALAVRQLRERSETGLPRPRGST